MSNPVYVIKSYQFGYNDEYFYVCGSNIHSTFTNQEEAEKQYRNLEVQAARRVTRLDEVSSIFEGTPEFRQQLSDFVLSKTGISLNLEEGLQGLPPSLSDEDVFAFVEMADMHSYQLLKFDEVPKLYALWLPKDNCYYMIEDEYSSSLVYSPSPDELFTELEDLIYDWQNYSFKGELTEISEHPLLLEQLLKTHPRISYDNNAKVLTVKGREKTPYIELNAILKQPFFEIRELSLEEVRQMEKEIANQYDETYEE